MEACAKATDISYTARPNPHLLEVCDEDGVLLPLDMASRLLALHDTEAHPLHPCPPACLLQYKHMPTQHIIVTKTSIILYSHAAFPPLPQQRELLCDEQSTLRGKGRRRPAVHSGRVEENFNIIATSKWQMGLKRSFPNVMCVARSSNCTASNSSPPPSSTICWWSVLAASSGAQRNAPERPLADRRSTWQRHWTAGAYSGGTRGRSMSAACPPRTR